MSDEGNERPDRAVPGSRASRRGGAGWSSTPGGQTVSRPRPARRARPSEESIPAGPADDHIAASSFELTKGGVGEVEADSVHVTQGGIGAASADQITVTMGGIGHAAAEEIGVRLGGIGIARGDHIDVHFGSVGLAVGSDVSIHQGFSRAVIGRDVRIDRAGAQTVVANHVTFERQGGALLILARRVEGNVRPVLDWRGALVASAMLALTVSLLVRRRRP